MKAKYWPCKGVKAAVRDAPVLLVGELIVGPRVFDESPKHTTASRGTVALADYCFTAERHNRSALPEIHPGDARSRRYAPPDPQSVTSNKDASNAARPTYGD
jgi:hypothetical protein